ncbi:hypothetical protein PALU110988_28135 [Paenibacillus lupini]|uniref:hypothetical protein n=1 Tax=Paenibacillus lupini TaxID=1450204 RepID=UPI00141FD59B|nr:hypothetical protein [Paenibacillus lupini]NIK21584.1 hypothetical protein [Paenibacillus lupini]
MRIYFKGIRKIIGVVFIGSVLGGVMVYQSINAKSDIYINHTNPSSYPINWQTYGPYNETASLEVLPDLIETGSINDIAGYVLKKDYLSESGRDVPLYDFNGKTIIGSIHIGAKNMNYPKNKDGQTYGSATDTNSPETEPELISAIGIDGTNGYVLKKDIDGELPKSPQEAIALQKSRPQGGRDIPLYDYDGETIIGLFHVGDN